jgi:hypothetical protein
MGRLATLLVPVFMIACGGSKKPPEPPKPVATSHIEKPEPPRETETDRENKRHEAAVSIVPDGSTCLPAVLKDDGAPRLDLVALGETAVVCAIDTDRSRLLGPIGCWKLDNLLADRPTLSSQGSSSMPGGSYDVLLDDRCARGYCLPKDAKIPADRIAHLGWSLDGSKLALLVGDDVHLFDAASKSHESTFSTRGDKGVPNDPIAVHLVKDTIFVEGNEGQHTSVWEFKLDGSQLGPIELLGGKDHKLVDIYGGSFSVLDSGQIALAEQGFSTVTTYEIKERKRAKLVRKRAKLTPPCKLDEIDTFWRNGDKVTDRCRDHLTKVFGHLIGANAVRGNKNWLLLLHGARIGELAVIDPKNLAEKRALKLPWCGSGKGGTDEVANPGPRKSDKHKPRGAVKKGGDGDREMGDQ